MESAQLLEESSDIDTQIAMLKLDLQNKLKSDENAANEALAKAIESIIKENKRRLEDATERVRADYEARLQRERERL